MQLRRIVTILALLPGTAAAQWDESFPPVAVVESERRYTITAHTLRGLREDLSRKMAAAATEFGHGATSSHLTWATTLTAGAEDCRLTRLEVQVEILITLPEWQPRRSPSRYVRDQWQRSFDALETHERVHRDHAVEAAESLRSSLMALPPGSDCTALSQAIDSRAQQELAHLRLRSQLFDSMSQMLSESQPQRRTSPAMQAPNLNSRLPRRSPHP